MICTLVFIVIYYILLNFLHVIILNRFFSNYSTIENVFAAVFTAHATLNKEAGIVFAPILVLLVLDLTERFFGWINIVVGCVIVIDNDVTGVRGCIY